MEFNSTFFVSIYFTQILTFSYVPIFCFHFFFLHPFLPELQILLKACLPIKASLWLSKSLHFLVRIEEVLNLVTDRGSLSLRMEALRKGSHHEHPVVLQDDPAVQDQDNAPVPSIAHQPAKTLFQFHGSFLESQVIEAAATTIVQSITTGLEYRVGRNTEGKLDDDDHA